jgi:phosphoserine phosphatase
VPKPCGPCLRVDRRRKRGLRDGGVICDVSVSSVPSESAPPLTDLPLPRFAAVCFDCDSTLTRLEGIDELAVRAGIADKIVPLTSAAMDGSLTLDEVYARRLDLIRPDGAALEWVGERYVAEVVEGAYEAVSRLQLSGVAVHVVSGGLLQPVLHLAEKLGIAAGRVHAVGVLLDDQGRYLGFDTRSPLARKGGKAEVVHELVARHGRVALVGDGVTDLEARDGGAYVVGFGGVVARPKVIAGADVFVMGPSLTAVLPALA